MITLSRRRDRLVLTRLLWDAAQVFARQEGWQPANAGDPSHPASYAPGGTVSGPDARRFAEAIVRVVNGPKADGGELDLARFAELVNFLRRGPFEIR